MCSLSAVLLPGLLEVTYGVGAWTSHQEGISVAFSLSLLLGEHMLC